MASAQKETETAARANVYQIREIVNREYHAELTLIKLVSKKNIHVMKIYRFLSSDLEIHFNLFSIHLYYISLCLRDNKKYH